MRNLILAAVVLSTFSTASLATSQERAMRAAIPPPYSPAFSRATQYHSLDAVDGKLSDQLSTLEAQADQGNAKAAATLYASLTECRLAAASPTSQEPPAFCEGLTPEQTANAGKWLDLAARNGDVDAQYGYAAAGFDAVAGVNSGRADRAAVEHYASRARGYLASLSKQCNYDAIGTIARESGQSSQIYKTDFNQAYIYLLIEETIARVPPDDSAYRAYLESHIAPPATAASLRHDAAAFVAQYCQ